MDATIEEQAKEIKRLKKEVAKLRKLTEWQPIETAPKGQILLYYGPEQTQDEWITMGLASGGYRKPTHWFPIPKPPAVDSEP